MASGRLPSTRSFASACSSTALPLRVCDETAPVNAATATAVEISLQWLISSLLGDVAVIQPNVALCPCRCVTSMHTNRHGRGKICLFDPLVADAVHGEQMARIRWVVFEL